MTDERKKYLASISKEERAIRQALAEEKGLISLCKNELNRICFSKRNATYKMLNTSKTRIKALKKQLPAPIDTHDWGVRLVNHCGVCGVSCITWHKYCPRCGQKLRW